MHKGKNCYNTKEPAQTKGFCVDADKFKEDEGQRFSKNKGMVNVQG